MNIFFPIRFYASNAETSPYRGGCIGFEHREFFHSSIDRLPPFQVRATGGLPPTSIYLVHCDNTSTQIAVSGLNMATDTIEVDGVEYTYYSHLGTDIGDAEMPAGLYQIHYGSLRSDPFFLTEDLDDMQHLTYRTEGLLGDMYFPAGMSGECHIDTWIDRPVYPIQEEVREDGAMNTHRVFQRYEKRHHIRFKGVESMADAMSLLPLMDEVYINDTRVYEVEVDITWDDEQDCLADIGVSYITAKVIKSF